MTTETNTDPNAIQPDDMQAAWDAELALRNNPDPTQVASDEAEVKTATETPATTKTEVDPVEARFAAVEAANQRLQEQLTREQGRTSALQKKLDTGLAAAKTAAEAPTKAAQEAAIEDPEEWKQLQADFPEWATAVQKKVDAMLKGVKQPAQTQSAPDGDAISSAVEQKIQEREFARVDRKHPGWRATVKSDDFVAWHKAQPTEVKALAESDYSSDAIELIDLFNARAKEEKTADDALARRKTALEVAAVTNKPRTPAARVTKDSDLTAQDVWKLEKQKREQKRKQTA